MSGRSSGSSGSPSEDNLSMTGLIDSGSESACDLTHFGKQVLQVSKYEITCQKLLTCCD